MTVKNWSIVECKRLFALAVEERCDRLLLLVFGDILQIDLLPEHAGGFGDDLERNFYSCRTMKCCPQDFVPSDSAVQRPLQPGGINAACDDESGSGTERPLRKSLLRRPDLSLLGRYPETLRGQIIHL